MFHLRRFSTAVNFPKSFKSVSNLIALRVHNGHFVCAEDNGRVITNRPWIGPWEVFKVEQISENQIALRTHHGKYLCAEGGGGREIVANRDKLDIWETFKLFFVSPEQRKVLDFENKEYSTITNNSNEPIFVKPEHSVEPVVVYPGHIYHDFDGFKIGNKVFKVVDRCDATIQQDKTIVLDCRNEKLAKIEIPFTSNLKEILMKYGIYGGFLDNPPSSDIKGWEKLFNATIQNSSHNSSTNRNRFPDPTEPGLSNRERWERIDRNQYETDRADNHRRTA